MNSWLASACSTEPKHAAPVVLFTGRRDGHHLAKVTRPAAFIKDLRSGISMQGPHDHRKLLERTMQQVQCLKHAPATCQAGTYIVDEASQHQALYNVLGHMLRTRYVRHNCYSTMNCQVPYSQLLHYL